MTASRGVAFDRLLFVGWWMLLLILPLGHLTGLRNTWTIFIVVATLAWVGSDAWRDLPARGWLIALLVWCALSIGWSTEAATSFAKWRTDLLLPLLAYAALFGLVRRTRSVAPLVIGVACGLSALAIVSLFSYLPVDDAFGLHRHVRTEIFPNIETPMPIWYPGVGDASMVASLAAGFLLFARDIGTRIGRWLLVIAWTALVVILLVANNRNAEIAIPLVIVCCLLLSRRRRETSTRSRRTVALRILVIGLLAGLVAAATALRLEDGARERLVALRIAVPPGHSAFLELTSRDTRPMIWRYYTKLALQHPWIGVGFGRTVPGMHYHTEDDQDLKRVETNAYSHAHNLFLNWWLQTGLVGVVLLVGALVEIVRHGLRRQRGVASADVERQRVAAGLALLSVVVLMLVRDGTDDFLVFGMATLFWSLVGALAGLRAPHREPAAISARRDR